MGDGVVYVVAYEKDGRAILDSVWVSRGAAACRTQELIEQGIDAKSDWIELNEPLQEFTIAMLGGNKNVGTK